METKYIREKGTNNVFKVIHVDFIDEEYVTDNDLSVYFDKAVELITVKDKNGNNNWLNIMTNSNDVTKVWQVQGNSIAVGDWVKIDCSRPNKINPKTIYHDYKFGQIKDYYQIGDRICMVVKNGIFEFQVELNEIKDVIYQEDYQKTSETIEIDGKIYDKEEVKQRLEKLKPLK